MIRRRSVLTALSALTVASGGCIDRPLFRDYSLRVDNYSPDPLSIRVRVGDDNSNTIIEESFEVGPQKVSENISVDGTPSSIHAKVDSESEQEFSWPSNDSGERFDQVYIWYDPGRNPNSDRDIFIHNE